MLVFAHLTFQLTEREPDIDRQAVVEPVEVPEEVEIRQPVVSDEPVFEKPVPTDRLAAQQQPQTQHPLPTQNRNNGELLVSVRHHAKPRSHQSQTSF